MTSIFEIRDKTKRKIRLSEERWKHITAEHPNVTHIEDIQQTIINPIKITPSKYNPENVCYYYRYDKMLRKYLMVAVRYLNGEGYIITAYHMQNIK